jgi:hypothetical protein
MSAYRFPNRAMIEIVAPCAKLDGEPRMGGVKDLEPLPALTELDGDEPAAMVRVAWWDGGLYIAATVAKSGPIAVNRHEPLRNDCVAILINTQPGPDQRRPTRSCWQFLALPRGGGDDRMAPILRHEPFRYGPPQRKPEDRDMTIASTESEDGYTLAMILRRSALGDAELAAGQGIGFEYVVHDSQWGQETWASPASVPVFDVPELWGRLELSGGLPTVPAKKRRTTPKE